MADNPRIEELRRRVQADPASIAFAQLAEEYRRAGNFDEAVRICRAGLERHPSYLSARVTLGRALIEIEQYEDARTELELVLRSAPENLAAIRGLAEIHQRRGDLNEALRQYQAALGIARHDPELEESVHDLSRQLGGPSSPVPDLEPPAPTAPPEPRDVAEIDLPPIEEAADAARPAASLSPELEAAADEFTKALQALDAFMIDLPPSAPADDLPADTQAAIAPDGPVGQGEQPAGRSEVSPPASVDTPMAAVETSPAAADTPPAPAEPAPAPVEPSLAAVERSPAAVDALTAAVEPAPAAAVDASPAEATPVAAEDPARDSDARVADELESWLDAIFQDRAERGS